MIDIKIVPNNIEAEESVLSGIIINNKTLPDIVDILLPEDFYRTAHQKIYSNILSLYKKKEPIDLVTLMNSLKEQKVLDETGGATYLATLIDTIPIVINIIDHAKIIKKTAVARQLIITANEISISAYNPIEDMVDILDAAQAKIINIKFDIGNNTFVPVSELLPKRIEAYEQMANNGRPRGLQTKFPEFDILTGGLIGGKLVIIAARPRIGKSALMMNLTNNIAQGGHKVGIFSIEMEKEELVDRQISSKSGVNLTKLVTGQWLSHEDWDKITYVADKIYNYPIVIDDTGGLKIQELKRRAREMVKDGVEIIFIDQLSKIRGGKGKTEYEQRTYIVNELATLKKDLRIPVCLLAQINRKLEDRQNKKPTLGDLKSTGALEEDADIILLGHREYEYVKTEETIHHAEWELAKHKQGATTNINMFWDGKTVTFSPIQTGII